MFSLYKPKWVRIKCHLFSLSSSIFLVATNSSIQLNPQNNLSPLSDIFIKFKENLRGTFLLLLIVILDGCINVTVSNKTICLVNSLDQNIYNLIDK